MRPLLNTCYREGKKKNPNLAGTFRININVNMSGKVAGVLAMPSELGKDVVACMTKGVKKDPFNGEHCQGKMVTLSKTWGEK